MGKIICSNAKCKYCNDNYQCTKEQIELNYCEISLARVGDQEYLKCKSYEERDDDWYLTAKKFIKTIIESEHIEDE